MHFSSTLLHWKSQTVCSSKIDRNPQSSSFKSALRSSSKKLRSRNHNRFRAIVICVLRLNDMKSARMWIFIKESLILFMKASLKAPPKFISSESTRHWRISSVTFALCANLSSDSRVVSLIFSVNQWTWYSRQSGDRTDIWGCSKSTITIKS